MNVERSVLGGMMLSRDALHDCLAILEPSDFADARLELVFRACAELADRAAPVDALTVAEQMGAVELARFGGHAFLAELVQSCAVPASAGYYAEQVRAAAKLRRVGRIGSRFAALSQGEAGDADEIVELARAELDTMSSASEPPTMSSIVDEALDDLDREDGLSTAWRELDDIISRWAPGRLYIAGARPGVGKSVFGACAALDVARRGHAALIMSAEMTRSEIVHRLVANVGTVSMSRMMHRRLTEDDWVRIADARVSLDTLPLVIDDRASMRVADVVSMARTIARRRPLGLIVVDYVQLLAPPSHLVKRSREEQVSHTARSLKNIAKQLRVPVLALAQLNRSAQQRADKRPSIADLRESGELEQAADVVLLLHRALDDSTDPDEPPDELAAIVPKNRQGPTAAFALRWEGDYARATSRHI